MKRIILVIIAACSVFITYAQTPLNVVISSGTKVVLSGTVQATMSNSSGSPAFTNNGTYTDNAGTFNDLAGLTFSGSGTTSLYNLNVNPAAGTTLFGSLVSVYNTATLAGGNMDADNNLYIRSDAGNATMVNNGSLTDNVLGVIANASVASGGCPSFTSNLTLDISGTEMLYQWQSSPDSAAWSNVSGATDAVYTATVTATTFFRCALTTANTAFSENTPGVKLAFSGVADAGTITGTASVCAGATTSLSDAVSGGVWSSASPSVGTVDASGVVTGIAPGTATISYAVTNACRTAYAMTTVTVNASPGPINGPTVVCNGATISLTDVTTTGAWSVMGSHTAMGPGPGGVSITGTSVGVDTLEYVVYPGCISSVTITVNATPVAISGAGHVCAGLSVSLSDGTAGGTWSNSSGSVASISSTGVVTGIGAGTTVISYTSSSDGCYATKVFTVNASPGPINGPASVCNGSVISLSDATAAGAWSVMGGHTSMGPGPGGVDITGNSVGVDTLEYVIFPGCISSVTITVNPLPDAGTITGAAAVCTGVSASLTDVAAGGVWSSSSSNALVDGSGNVTGVAAGTATISYTVATGCGTVSATSVATVNATATGTISGASGVAVGSNITLTDAVSGGAWSASNGNATVSGGMVHGVSAGTVTISYTVTGICGAAAATKLITVSSGGGGGSVAAITGYYFYMCAGSSASFNDATTGGTWSIDPATASVASVSATGVVTGLTAGTATIIYTAGTSAATATVTVYPLPAAISGSAGVCQGATTSLSDATPGGVWSSGIPSYASVGTSGIVTGTNVGAVPIYYTLTAPAGCRTSVMVSVNPNPSAITGPATVCTGASITLSDATAGGAWSSASSTVSVSGASVTGVSTGTALVTYMLTTGCYKTTTLTINGVSAGTISGSSTVSAGAHITLTDATTGGVWSASNGNATVSSGIVTGVAAGTVVISYTVTNSCGAAFATYTVNVTPSTVSGITGTLSVCNGLTTALTDATPGGTWHSSNTMIATVSTAGVVTGAASGTGTATISYTAGGVTATAVVTLNSNPSGIGGTTSVCNGASVTMSDLTTGGAWTSTAGVSVTTGSTTTTVTGASTGTSTVSYTLPTGCYRTYNITVKAQPTAILGNLNVCGVGAVTFLSDATTPGTSWTISPVATATVSASGRVYGVALGTATVTYTASTGCIATAIVSVHTCPAAPGHGGSSVSGTVTVSAGNTTTLNDEVISGSWTSSNTGVVTVENGIAYGIAPGMADITHTFTDAAGESVTSVTPVVVSAVYGDVSIIPNPNKGTFTVKGMLGAAQETDAVLEISDMLGQVVYKHKFTSTDGAINEQVTLDKTLANGTYLLNVRTANESKVFHFVVEQ